MDSLKIENLSSGYNEKRIVRNLFLEALPGETLVLMGPSGSGKTTLLLTILGIIVPLEGKILLKGENIVGKSIEERNIGYLPQDYGLFPNMDVQENVSFGLKVRGMRKELQEEKAREMLQLVNLKGFEKRKVKELSGGEKQRVGLARALTIDPALLLLDEPLSNIDPVTKYEVSEQLKQLFCTLNIPIILVTHNHEDAFFLADKLAILVNGVIEQSGPIQEVQDHPKSVFIKRLLRPFAKDFS